MELKLNDVTIYNTIAVIILYIRYIKSLIYSRKISCKEIMLTLQFVGINSLAHDIYSIISQKLQRSYAS